MIKITHVITNLAIGGAEIALENLIDRLPSEKFENSVISLMELDTVGERLKRKGIKVTALGMCRGLPSPRAFIRLVRILKKEKPDIMQTWLYHADLASVLASFFIKPVPLLWNIRCVDMLGGKKLTPLYPVMKLLSWFSGRPKAVVINSEAGRSFHENFGYKPEKLIVIQNGIDADKFQPSVKMREDMRNNLGLDNSAQLVGLVGRYDAIKGFDVFLDAVLLLKKDFPQLRIALAGEGTGKENGELEEMIEQRGLSDITTRLGVVESMQALYPAFDIFTSASLSEGFSNVTAEAMACGVPCVVTDVGDSAHIIGDTGFPVPAGDYKKLAENLKRMLLMTADELADLGNRARLRILEKFSPQSAIAKYEDLYTQTALQAPKR